MRELKQYILWKFVHRTGLAKPAKVPVDHATGASHDPLDPSIWLTFDEAVTKAADSGHGVGFVLTEQDPYFLFDLDDCLQSDGTWTPQALDVVDRLRGAMVEISVSGQGLHVIGQYNAPLMHTSKNTAQGFELYTKERFIALGDYENATGDALANVHEGLVGLVAQYFMKTDSDDGAVAGWTSEPVAEYTHLDDETLLRKAMASRSGGSAFFSTVTFRDLWEANEEILEEHYPDTFGNGRGYDGSNVDGALAMHLAFWTGRNCDRVAELMKRSALVRDKWERDTYFNVTVQTACSRQTEVYSIQEAPEDTRGLSPLKANSDEQRNMGAVAREKVLAQCEDDPAKIAILAENKEAAFWIDNQTRTPDEIIAMVSENYTNRDEPRKPQLLSGFQYVDAVRQLEHFEGCYYVHGLHQVFTPRYGLLNQERFRVLFGGFSFQMSETSSKSSKNAWEAFTESQVCLWPTADRAVFRPDREPGEYFQDEVGGDWVVNMYRRPNNTRAVGDVTPFLDHLALILPEKLDRDILLAYMAACVQHQGVKFTWAPFIQGAPGNGKTLISKVLGRAIGRNYTHWPKASDIDNKFNAWQWGNIFVGVEDIDISAPGKREVFETLKTMITGEEAEIQAKGSDQVTQDVCFNMVFNGNNKEGVPKTADDRRFAVFFCAQQSAADVMACGQGGDYFPKLYTWLKREGGFKFVSEYLHTYDIPDALNPATKAMRAPETSSFTAAVDSGRTRPEVEILNAVGEQRAGFCGGWVSSIALGNLFAEKRVGEPRNRWKSTLEGLGYVIHPALIASGGRSPRASVFDENRRPTLYIKTGSVEFLNVTDPRVAFDNYMKAQASEETAAAFGVGATQ